MPHVSKGGNIRSLTGVRGIAALYVALFHFAAVAEQTHEGRWLGMAPFIRHGYLGVDLFFILSGFILYHVYRDTFSRDIGLESWGLFLKFRFARIYPVHVVTMTLMVLLCLACIAFLGRWPEKVAFGPEAIAANLLMVHAWIGVPAPNYPAWSISAEWMIYLVFPILCRSLTRAPATVDWFIVVLCLASVNLFGETHPLLRITPEFILGITLYKLNDRFFLAGRIGMAGAFFACVVAIVLEYLKPTDSLGLYAAIFGVLIVFLSNPRDGLGRLCATQPMVYLGEISYSFYMLQALTGVTAACLRRLLPGLALAPGLVPVPLMEIAATLGAAIVLHHRLELPARRMLQQWTPHFGAGRFATFRWPRFLAHHRPDISMLDSLSPPHATSAPLTSRVASAERRSQ
jgi:peptidoglycan/LPS O-acetylase OafA/YrhL